MIDRRQIIALLAGVVATPALAQTGMSRMTAYAFSFTGLKGGDIKLADFAGKPILVVNTASLCGYTPQYAGLQELWTALPRARADDRRRAVERFRRPGAGRRDRDRAHRASGYGVAFPLAAKAVVRGDRQHPFYKWAAAERPLELPRWNFHKYLIGRDGHIVASFATSVEPTDPRVTAAIEKELGRST